MKHEHFKLTCNCSTNRHILTYKTTKLIRITFKELSLHFLSQNYTSTHLITCETFSTHWKMCIHQNPKKKKKHFCILSFQLLFTFLLRIMLLLISLMSQRWLSPLASNMAGWDFNGIGWSMKCQSIYWPDWQPTDNPF